MVRALGRCFGGLLLLGIACTTDLSSELEGLECRAQEPQCLPGYTCNPDNRCMRLVSVQTMGGAGGAASGGAGAGGAGAAGAGADGAGVAGAAGSSPAAGGSAGNASDAGTSGSGGFGYDAGPGLDALDASVLPDAQACATPTDLFRDEDEDGFGVTAQKVRGCPPLEKWALQGGDCRDDLPDVHPEQMTFFAAGYPDPTRPSAGNISFDYDCDFVEEPEPSVVEAPACSQLLTCEGSGYVAASPARSGPGINAICGSAGLSFCQSTTILGLGCTAQPTSGAPAPCH